MTVRVLALASGVTDLTGHRYHESAGFTQAGVGNARSGIIPTSGAADVSQVSTMVVSVAGFAAWIDGTASANQAGYNFVSDAATQITIADGEASVARTDRIWAVVHHDVFDSSGQTVGAVEYGKGQATGAAAPLPASAILLYEFSVPAGRSAANGGVLISSFVDKRTYTVAAGGVIPTVSQADRDAIVSPYKGMPVWRQEYGHLEIWDNQWHAQGVPALTSLSVAAGHLTNPADGSLFFAKDTRGLYQYDAAAGQWKPYGLTLCKMHLSADQLFASTGSAQLINLSTVDIDTDSMADTTNHQIVITKAGTYRITAAVTWHGGASVATGTRAAFVFSGASVIANALLHVTNTNPVSGTMTAYAQCNGGETFTLRAWWLPASGSATGDGLSSGNGGTWLAAERVS